MVINGDSGNIGANGENEDPLETKLIKPDQATDQCAFYYLP